MGDLLGRGGMSAVYEATHRNGKRVAIKVLRVDLQGNERTRRRFMREGYIANQVGHDGVVEVLDDDVTEDGAAFIVMQLLEGVDVEQYRAAQGGMLPQGDVLAIADAVLDILIAAHAKSIIHRDIKPSNLFLTSTGRLKLLDFGIASHREASPFPHTTAEGAILGTPGFMAPEQARGRLKDIDARTDLWAVGALMFRLLTGRLVYETENSNEYMIAAATETAPSLASVAPSLPLGIAELVDRALKSDPATRFQTALEMQSALRAQMAHFDECRLPSPAPLENATLDEPASTNLASELVDRTPSRRLLPPLRPLVTRRQVIAYGVLGLLVFLYWVSPARKEATLPANQGIDRTASPSQREAPPAAMTLHSETSIAPVEPQMAPAPTSQATATAVTPVSRAPAPGGSARNIGTKRARSEASAPSASEIPARAPAPARLEDLLDDRR